MIFCTKYRLLHYEILHQIEKLVLLDCIEMVRIHSYLPIR